MSATPQPIRAGAALRDNRADGAALARIAVEVRDLLADGCESCLRRVPRKAVWGTDDSYVHEYGGDPGTIAPCTAQAVPNEVFDDVDTVEQIGMWLLSSSPIVLPLTLPAGIPAGPGTANALVSGLAAITSTASGRP